MLNMSKTQNSVTFSFEFPESRKWFKKAKFGKKKLNRIIAYHCLSFNISVMKQLTFLTAVADQLKNVPNNKQSSIKN